ncbi:hypothetical protein CP533_3492 [Ophiocordyceps camponoti-saundersi (nom. inval.)]|nr:hypothetical protein CP533_3492 [Ophiocordyceps camponoti-saundersi (nom. inval.)]
MALIRTSGCAPIIGPLARHHFRGHSSNSSPTPEAKDFGSDALESKRIGRTDPPSSPSELMQKDPDFQWFRKGGSGPDTEGTKLGAGDVTPYSADEAAKMPLNVRMRHTSLKEKELWRDFSYRHIGPRSEAVAEMLKALGSGAETLDSFVSEVIPPSVIQPPKVAIVPHQVTELAASRSFNAMHSHNERLVWMNGGGYYPTEVPFVIRRNILENPAWYTSYTPYQPEISQGRLESLLNFQTMISDLTGLPVANASLLDEGTAAAEAMTMSYNNLPSRVERKEKVYLVSSTIHKTTLWVMRGRAEAFGIRLQTVDLHLKETEQLIKDLGSSLVGVLVQYPDTLGGVRDHRKLAGLVHDQGALLSVATDLFALTMLTPPGEFGADIAFGNSQRFGVPMGFGGPHAAFMSVKESLKRRLPGRLVGVSKDRTGRRALRLTLQTREQHIRREKATSNVCTAQALLANMAVNYAIYHGPEILRSMAVSRLRFARMLQAAAEHYGLEVSTGTVDPNKRVLFDTIAIRDDPENLGRLHKALVTNGVCGGESWDRRDLMLAVPSRFNDITFVNIVKAFRSVASLNSGDNPEQMASAIWCEAYQESAEQILAGLPDAVRRKSSFLTHPVFNSYHSETEMLRYLHHLQSKDLSLVHSMIPLGSCTMKLNSTSQMSLVAPRSGADAHPNAPMGFFPGWKRFLFEFGHQLNAVTGMHASSVQPNSGAQGEFAGLRIIRKYHERNEPDKVRDVCLIPVSAHGTNPASATMAGMEVVSIKCDVSTGNLDLEDLKAKCKKYSDRLGAIMITYPSTYGVFEPDIREICDIVHRHGGQVYMDGANMNAQIGLTSPGALGADVCHLNLHKTFCIPHGGGGPGVGPICVKEHLSSFLPHKLGRPRVSSANYGSASILPISWSYMCTMGDKNLTHATKVALLNANYMLTRLKEHYPILYTNEKGRCAHEFIVDARPFKATSGIEAIDIAKRLQDYGFHAPTMSWPVPNTLMIEPTESESKEEIDRFVDAMISIRKEIAEIEKGNQPRKGNVLKMAPHTQADLIDGDGDGKWERPYSRETAAYPMPYLREKKFWPTVTRVDDAYGDTHVFCTCPPLADAVSPAGDSADAAAKPIAGAV